MKKVIFPMIFLGALFLFGTHAAEAQQVVPKKAQSSQTVQPGFVDANGDGICDTYNGTRPGKGLGPGNGQGKGFATGKGLGKGSGLMDGSGKGRQPDGSRAGRGNGKQLRDGSGGNCPSPSK